MNQVGYSNDDWFLDSGATHHVCNNSKLIHNLKLLDVPERLTVGNDSICQILGVGEVHLVTNSRKNIVLTKVLYSPDMKKNLVTYGCRVIDEKMRPILSARLHDSLYRICAKSLASNPSV